MALKDLSIPLPAKYITLNPQTMQDAWSMHVVLQIHRGLFKYDSEGAVVNDLILNYSESSDKKRITLKLKDAFFSDGRKLNAIHVVNTMRRLFEMESSITADLRGIVGSKEIKTGSKTKFGVVAEDNQTVVFIFENPNVLLKTILATPDCSILPIESLEDKVDGSIGLGPYKIEAKNESSILLSLRPNQNAKAPSKILYKLDVKNIEHFENNTVADHYELPSDEIESLEKKGFKKSVSDATREWFLMLNANKLPEDLRSKIGRNIDVMALKHKMNKPNLIPSYGLIPYGLPGANLKPEKQLPTEKTPNSKLKYRGTLSILFPKTWKDGNILAEEVQRQLGVLGIKTILKNVSFEDWLKAKGTGDFEVLINSRGIDYPDPYAILGYFRGHVSQNYLKQNDSKIDHLLDLALVEFNYKNRIKIYDEIEEIILKRNVIVPLFFGAFNSSLWPPVVEKVPSHPLGFHFLSLEKVEMKE